MESSTLKECGEGKARGTFHPKCRSKKRKVSSLLSLHFFSFLWFCFFVFFFLFFCLRRRRCQGENAWNEKVETWGQKWKPKVRGQSKSLKVSSLLFLHFFFSMVFCFFFFHFLLLEKKKMLRENIWNRRAKVRGQKWKPKMRA